MDRNIPGSLINRHFHTIIRIYVSWYSSVRISHHGAIYPLKILLINQAFVSPDEPGHTRHYELAQYLKQYGHELVIVGSDINYQTGERIIQHRGLSAEQNLDGVQVVRAYIYPIPA